jgi:hypothetical protein
MNENVMTNGKVINKKRDYSFFAGFTAVEL